jgi:hypothetical protein
MCLELVVTKRTDERLLTRMENHYSEPKGFVGRNICYAVMFGGVYYGHIVAGSAARFLPNRNEYLGVTINDLSRVINNIFYNVAPINGGYPLRNFTSRVVRLFVSQAEKDWFAKYGDICCGFETLVEKPRSGELYKKAGWEVVGETRGYTCKRTSGRGTDSWSGKRVWNTTDLRPKTVLCYRNIEHLR